jgi:hypothetical protein
MATAYVTLGGGLGNQLFQAALGVALADAHGAEVIYVDNGFQFDSFGRKLHLARFVNLKLDVVARERLLGLPLVREADYGPEVYGELLRNYPALVFEGYFQNERFFLGRHAPIKAAFQFQVRPEIERAGEALRSSGAIGIHVRRSEYGFLGLASAAYYINAIADIRREIGPAPVACFSDEPNFCRAVFSSIPDLTVHAPDTDDPLEDFHLLSRCAHHVIANSSFSWWAAWLGQGENSIVYAPAPWFTNDLAANPVPARWRRVEGAVRAP